MKFAVTSQNRMKISSVEAFLRELFPNATGLEVIMAKAPSDVSDQPTTLLETQQGAINRIYNCDAADADFIISIESGVEREFDCFYGFTFVAVSDSTKNRYGFGTSTKFPIPDCVASGLEKGIELCCMSNSENGLISSLSNQSMKRCDLIKEALGCALIEFGFFNVDLPDKATIPKELLKFVNVVSDVERNAFARQLKELDFSEQKIIGGETTAKTLEPVEAPCKYDGESLQDIFDNGTEAIRNGEVAVVVMAGGQGSRLSAPVPKGLMELDIPSKSTLLQLQMLRVKKLEKEYCRGEKSIPFYILTSDSTHSPIAAYLIRNGFFGLKHVKLVKQNTLPARYLDGKFVLSGKAKVLAAPNGNGAVFECLKNSGALSEMKELGVKYVDIHPIDNALARPADPYFVGSMIYEEGDASLKVVRKVGGGERIGTICKRNGKTVVVEYSEIPKEQADDFMYGNTAMHLFTTALIEKAADYQLPYHVATKREKVINESGEQVVSEVHKYERFIFDAMELCDRVVLYEVNRDEEFAPIKNASGAPVDSPETAVALLLGLHRRWAVQAGATLSDSSVVEFSPATTYAGEGLNLEGFSTAETAII